MCILIFYEFSYLFFFSKWQRDGANLASFNVKYHECPSFYLIIYIYIKTFYHLLFFYACERPFFLYLRILNYFVNLKFLYKKIWQTKKWENDLIAINSSSLIISAWTNYRQNTDRQSLGLFSLIREFSDRNLWSRQKKAAFKEF